MVRIGTHRAERRGPLGSLAYAAEASSSQAMRRVKAHHGRSAPVCAVQTAPGGEKGGGNQANPKLHEKEDPSSCAREEG